MKGGGPLEGFTRYRPPSTSPTSTQLTPPPPKAPPPSSRHSSDETLKLLRDCQRSPTVPLSVCLSVVCARSLVGASTGD